VVLAVRLPGRQEAGPVVVGVVGVELVPAGEGVEDRAAEDVHGARVQDLRRREAVGGSPLLAGAHRPHQ
jgi:hypothetical protein